MGTVISVLVPIYNVENYIERCVRSLFEQTYKNIEYIFVNDCTPDESVEILQRVLSEYPDRQKQVTIVNHESNKGLAAARNSALSVATGDYIIHIDSDDYIEKETLALMLEKAELEHVDMVICDFKLEYPDKSVYLKNNFVADKRGYLELLLCRKSIVSVVARLVKREIIVDNQVFFIDGLNQGEDYVTSPRLTYYCKSIAKVDLALYHYIQYNSSSYIHQIDLKAIDDIVRANRILIDFFLGVAFPPEVLNECKAMNVITLLYVSDIKHYDLIASLCKDIDLKSLSVNIIYRAMLFMLLWKWYALLFNCVRIINRYKRR